MRQAAPNVEDIFHAALELNSPEARLAYLDGACADAELRLRVERLLVADARGRDFLESPASTPRVTGTGPGSMVEEPGTVIGPYKLLEAIGEGGMGTVFMAEQHEPVRRRVALKVIKPGMDSRQVTARFEAERQALAMMDHPNIAKVHDGGMTPAGRPYFVMELVRGLPITEYCDRHQTPVPERLELFVLVCRAVQHAHQKGVIHRDIKPFNVLVTLIDGVAVPKVIDFGVAKAIGQALTDKTLFTGFHQFVGTPLYVSPEQADLSGVDVDTRSDIYSLGVLLYELLTGTTPFDAETLKRVAFDEMRRIIRQDEPPRPSARVGTLGEALSTVSARRKVDPERLAPSMRGDLDWIVMRCLEKDRGRRYETAAALAADLGRYLGDEPVDARPPSAWYRARKFARRNRAALAMGAILASAILVMVASIGWNVRDRSARRAQLGDAINVALGEAHAARGRALVATASRPEWEAALASAFASQERAEAFVGQDRGAIEPEARRKVAELRSLLDTDEVDRRFVAHLDDLLARVVVWNARRSRSWRGGAWRELADALASSYGLQLGPARSADVANVLRARPRAVRDFLLAALHVELVLAPEDDPMGRRLRDALDGADDDPWRSRARRAFAGGDWPELERLLKDEAAGQQPPAMLHILAGHLPNDAWVTKQDVFLRIQRLHPGEPWATRFGGAMACDQLAWELVTGPDPAGSTAERGRELAEQAVRLAPQDGDFWNTLGIARYRTGDCAGTIEALGKAMELSEGGSIADRLFLAMAHWQLGHRREARRWYDETVGREEKDPLLGERLPRFRAEAADLLEVR